MKSIFTLLLVTFSVFTIFGQSDKNSSKFNLDFEKFSEGKLPEEWTQWGSGYNLKSDQTERKSGNASLSIEPAPEKPGNSFGAVAYRIPANYAGKEIELRGFLKMKDVSEGFGGLFLRIDGESGPLQFDNMQSRNLNGTADWAEYSIKLPLPEEATFIFVGALLTGKGKLWVDDLRLSIDGKDIAEAKARPAVVYKASLDKEFDSGSRIDAISLNKAKIEDLAVLGKVWGFLKYHHPAIAAGDYNWDYELFRILPKILEAKNKTERNDILSGWIEKFGTFETGDAEKIEAAKIKLSPDLSWINDKTLGVKTAQQLNRIKNAKRQNKSYYLGFFPGVGNPQFKNEEAYPKMNYPDTGFRLLGLYRYWNIIQYFFPNRHLIGEDWNNVLPEFIPQFVNARDELEYKKAALVLIGRINDTHANIWGKDAALDKYRGQNLVPLRVNFVEEKAVVIGFLDQNTAEKSGLKIGDVIEAVNGKNVSDIVKERLALTPASNYPTKLRDIARFLLQTNENFLTVKYRRENVANEIKLDAYPREQLKPEPSGLFARPASAFKLIAPNISYLYPGVLKQGEITQIIPEIAKTKGFVIDLRSYPSDFIVFSLGEFLMPKPTEFVKFSNGSNTNPGLFTYTDVLKVGKENNDYYKGKVVILINETTQSQAEYTTMAFRAAPRATVIGSTTAGADGNVSQFFLPGGISTMISGIGVYYPDGKETQRIGIVPDLEIKPTIKGIREGKDELLDKAVEIINSK